MQLMSPREVVMIYGALLNGHVGCWIAMRIYNGKQKHLGCKKWRGQEKKLCD